MTIARGFSLLELIVTMVIAAILAAIVIPLFNQSEIEASWFHEQVKAAIRYAQRQAVAQRRQVFVVVGATTVELCYDAGCAARVPQITTGTAYTLTAPSGVSLGPTTFSFNGLGQPTPIAGTTFGVAGKPVIVTSETGYVQ